MFKSQLVSNGSEVSRRNSAVEISTSASPLDCGQKHLVFNLIRSLKGGGSMFKNNLFSKGSETPLDKCSTNSQWRKILQLIEAKQGLARDLFLDKMRSQPHIQRNLSALKDLYHCGWNLADNHNSGEAHRNEVQQWMDRTWTLMLTTYFKATSVDFGKYSQSTMTEDAPNTVVCHVMLKHLRQWKNTHPHYPPGVTEHFLRGKENEDSLYEEVLWCGIRAHILLIDLV